MNKSKQTPKAKTLQSLKTSSGKNVRVAPSQAMSAATVKSSVRASGPSGTPKVPKRLRGGTTVLAGPKAITGNTDLSLQSCTPTEDINVVTQIQIVQAAAIGIITFASQRGFQDPNEESVMYYAYVYLVSLLTNTMRNAPPTVQVVPKFLRKILDAIKPKRVNIGSGSVGYVWTTDFNPLSTTWIYNMSPSSSPRDWNVGVISGSFINGIVPVLTAPSAYTTEKGEAAWSLLLQFIGDFYNSPNTKLVPLIDPAGKNNKYLADASAFSNNRQMVGDSGSGNGGYAKNITSEVPPQHPGLACFAANVAAETGDPYRLAAYSVLGSGDACFCTYMMASNFNERFDRSRIAPVYKSVDFNRFVDVLGRWMSKVTQMAFDDIQIRNGVWLSDPSYLTCPLTFQEFKLMLRNILMNAFQDTQGAVQNCLPGSSVNVTNNFLPFICGPNTRPVEQTQAQLPAPLVENIRSLVVRSQKSENPYTVIPVLGEYQLDTLDGSDYGYTSDLEPTLGFIPVFTPPPLDLKVDKNDKKKTVETKEKRVGVETQISMVDGSYGAGYAKINDPNMLSIYTNNWNAWVDKIKPFCDGFTTLGKDGGIAGLQVNVFTQMTYENIPEHPSLLPGRHSSFTLDVPERLKQKTLAIDNLYNLRVLDVTTCSNAPIANVWQLYQQYAIQPQMIEWGTGNDNEKMSPEKWQSFSREYLAIKNPPGSTNQSLGQLHDEYAALMVRARNGEVNNVTKLLEELEKNGEGGIFASVLGTIAKVGVGILSAPGVIEGTIGAIPF